MSNTQGARGKVAEKMLLAHLTDLNNRHMAFAYERLPDARSAGGMLKACICDYLVWWKPPHPFPNQPDRISIQLEVKETKHDYRIGSKQISQLPRMRRVQNAGGQGVILIHHSTINKWRVLRLEFFLGGESTTTWDLSSVPLFDTAAKALASTDLFPV